MIRNCDVYKDVGSAMLAFFLDKRNRKYMKHDRRMAISTPMFAVCEWMLEEYKGENIE